MNCARTSIHKSVLRSNTITQNSILPTPIEHRNSVNTTSATFIRAHTMSSNRAAWQVAAKAKPFEIKSAPIGKPEGSEILIRNHALAVNPIDANLQAYAFMPLEYPTIFGSDVAGEVAAVGPNVTRFQMGDRVLGFAVGVQTKREEEKGFQEYTIVNSHMASELPPSMAYEDASVIPLGVSTAACGLFQEAPFLQLQYPTQPAQKSTGKTILIWGGSSSVGSSAIQLAVAAGYEVVAVASAKHFDLAKRIGASQVFDYNASNVEAEIISALKGKDVVGAFDAVGGAACVSCVNIVHKLSGKGTVISTKGGADSLPDGVVVQKMFGTTLKDNAVGPAIYQDFLPKALKAGSFVPAPKPHIVGKGLESLQAGCDLLLKGVSASKVVVTL